MSPQMLNTASAEFHRQRGPRKSNAFRSPIAHWMRRIWGRESGHGFWEELAMDFRKRTWPNWNWGETDQRIVEDAHADGVMPVPLQEQRDCARVPDPLKGQCQAELREEFI